MLLSQRGETSAGRLLGHFLPHCWHPAVVVRKCYLMLGTTVPEWSFQPCLSASVTVMACSLARFTATFGEQGTDESQDHQRWRIEIAPSPMSSGTVTAI